MASRAAAAQASVAALLSPGEPLADPGDRRGGAGGKERGAERSEVKNEPPRASQGSQTEEAELRRALTELSGDFDRWKRGEIDSFELTERIHKFHQGPNREIYNRYSVGGFHLVPVVDYAIREGLIAKESVPPEALPQVETWLTVMEDCSLIPILPYIDLW